MLKTEAKPYRRKARDWEDAGNISEVEVSCRDFV
jgi:hypothetical protein